MTTENNDVSNAGGDTARRGRGPAKAKRVRRNYASELSEMQFRCAAARDMLEAWLSENSDSSATLFIRAAIRLLPQGEA